MSDYFDQNGNPISEEEYQRRKAAKEQRRKKRQMQRLILLGTFALAIILLIVVIVLIFRAIFKPKDDVSSSVPPSSIVSGETSEPESVPMPGYDWPVAVDPNVWNLVLVNKTTPLPDGFNVELAPVTNVGHQFDARAADALKNMVAACNENDGYELVIKSGYRGEKTQNERYQALVAAVGEEAAKRNDPPYGQNDHQTGLAVDFSTGLLGDAAPSATFAETPEFTWLMEHAAEYGFILRYPAEKTLITDMDYLPYHWRYVGVEDAQIIKNSVICLEEYLVALPGTTGAGASGEGVPAGPPENDTGDSGSSNAEGSGSE